MIQNLNDEKLFKLVEEYFGGTHYAVGDMVLHNETGHCHSAYLYRAFAQEVIDVALKDLVMDVRCEGCGYMTHHREHMGCVRAAKQHTHPAPSVPADVVRDAIAAVREQYRGTDWGKAAECICDAIDAAIAAAKENK